MPDERQFTIPSSIGFPEEVVTDNPIPGWTLSNPNGGAGTFNPSVLSYPDEAPEGNNVAWSSASDVVISQVLTDVVVPNTLYILEVAVGNRLDTPFPGYSLELFAGGGFLNKIVSPVIPEAGRFATATLTYASQPGDPNAGQPLEIRLESFGHQSNFDNVRLKSGLLPAQ